MKTFYLLICEKETGYGDTKVEILSNELFESEVQAFRELLDLAKGYLVSQEIDPEILINLMILEGNEISLFSGWEVWKVKEMYLTPQL